MRVIWREPLPEGRLALDGLPPLADVIDKHGLRPKKALGQNFLLDLNITSKIARMAGDLSACDVVEVGPGPGGLTRALLAAGARKVLAIERDARCLSALEEVAHHWPDRLKVIEADALTIDLSQHVEPGFRVVANLPYNVGTELLLRWLCADHWPPGWSSLTLMFQREVAERIVAQPGDKAYGRLSVLSGWRCESRILFDLPPQAFTPPPKVVSSVVSITPRAQVYDAPLNALQQITGAAFGQRRKMLRRSLSGFGGEALLERVGIDPTLRGEALTVEQFCDLARELVKTRAPK